MKYWIVIDSWNLMETFTSESLSPHIFYLERAFGNDLTRYISKNGELFNNLVLYAEEPSSDFAIELDGSLLDTPLLSENKKKKNFLYPKTVYFQKGKVRFRFKNQDSIKGRFYKFNLPLASSQNLFKATANVILFPQI